MKIIFIFYFLTASFIINGQEHVSKSVNLISSTNDDSSNKTFLKNFGTADDWLSIKSISLYGGGSLLGLVTADAKIEDTTSPTGSIGLNFTTDRISSNLYFSYNGRKTIDLKTLSQFGNSLMNPNLGGQSLTFSALGKLDEYFGVSTSFQIADNLWKINEDDIIDASPVIFRFGLYCRPFNFDPQDQNDNDINLTFNIHYTHRSILGDFNNTNQIIEDQTISPKGYNGLDFSINTYLNSVHLYVQFSRNSKKNLLIPGFSGSQVTFGINVTGNLIKIKNDDS